jgi:predicted alpha/beta-fold hydrolase
MSLTAKQWKFNPHPLAKNGHLQSLLGIRWPTGAPPYQAQQHQVQLDDGDQLVLHEDPPAEAAETAPIVLLTHGLAGSYRSSYMRRVAHRLTQHGYRVFRLDMRGCGAGEGVAQKPVHCGMSDDFAAALHCIAELYPDTTTSIVAFSMSGSITLNLLAEAGNLRVGNLDRSMVICPPIDLAHVENHFRSFWGKRYDRFFMKLLWKQIQRRWQRFPELAPATLPEQPKKLRQLDELIVAPANGFASAADYYAQASPGPKLASITQPVTIVFAEDDPVVPIEPLFEVPHSSSIEVITTRHGGHLGFLSGRHDDPDFRWLDWRILDWLAAGKQSGAAQTTAQQQQPAAVKPPHFSTGSQATDSPTTGSQAKGPQATRPQPAESQPAESAR